MINKHVNYYEIKNIVNLKYLRPVSLVALTVSIAAPMRALADVDSSSATPTNIEEVVVTAQRRSENLKDVPIAVTAISARQLTDLNIVTVKDVQLITPGLTFDTGYNFAQPFIRGVGTSNPTPGVESAVASYVDGAYQERAEGEITDFFDMSGVQVLKGAQGTLWGRNATGGAILYTTNDPEMGEYSTKINVEYGDYNHTIGDVITNIPLTDTLALRLGGHYSSQAGYINNLVDGQKLGGRSSADVRGKVKWQPTDDFSAVFTLEYYHALDWSGNTFRQSSAAPLCGACAIPAAPYSPVAGFYDVAQDTTAAPFFTNESHGNLHLNYAGDYFTLNSVTSYGYESTNVRVDEGISPYTLFDYDAKDGGRTLGEEFQVASKFDGMINGLAGLSYMHDLSYDHTLLDGASFTQLVQAGLGEPMAYDAVTTDSYAGFGEVYVSPIERLKFTAGGRFTEDERKLTGQENLAANLALTAPGTPQTFNEHARFYKFTPRVVIDYNFDVVNLYASWNRGFKAGGYNTPAFSPPNVVSPEKIDNYEAGAKYVSLDHRLRLNIAAFLYNYTNIQVYIVSIASGGQTLQNAAGAHGRGFEFDGSYRVAPWLTTFGSVAYLSSRYTGYPAASIVNPTSAGLITGTENLASQMLPRAPDFNGSLGFNLNAPVTSDLMGNLTVVGHYTTRYDFYPAAGGPLGHDFQPGYEMINMTAYVEPQEENAFMGLKDYKIGVYINNVTGAKYYLLRGTSAGFGEYEQAGLPRTFGIRVSADF